MMSPLFSVIIPTLNEELFLPHLLTSLAHQTERNFEVIVVDGKSRDKTVHIAKSWLKKVPGLTLIVSDRASLPHQRNEGAWKAAGEWLIFADADSVFLPYFIERLHTFIDARRPAFATTWFRPDSEVSGDALLTILMNLTIEGALALRRPLAPGPLTIVSRRAFDAVGGYDESHDFNEDVDFSLRLDKAGFSLSILRETLCVWSLRRLRTQGTLRVFQQYAQAAIPIFFLKRAKKNMPGYLMGGHLYGSKHRPMKRSRLAQYEKRLKKLIQELFE